MVSPVTDHFKAVDEMRSILHIIMEGHECTPPQMRVYSKKEWRLVSSNVPSQYVEAMYFRIRRALSSKQDQPVEVDIAAEMEMVSILEDIMYSSISWELLTDDDNVEDQSNMYERIEEVLTVMGDIYRQPEKNDYTSE